MVKSSIIVPTAGRPKAVKAAIQSLLAFDPARQNAEVIVVDNNLSEESSADLEQYCSQFAGSLTYIRESSPGLTAARHAGASAAKGELLTFIDDDVEVTSEWLPAIQRGFEDSSVAMVGGPSIPKFTCSIPAWFWDFIVPTPFGGWCCTWLSLLDVGKDVFDFDPNYIWGLNLSIRKKVLFDCGGFHIDIVPAQFSRWQGDGETGLTMKVKRTGYRSVYLQSALIMHVCGADRLNIEYFKKRAYYQGVCNSYTRVREGENPVQSLLSFNSSGYQLARQKIGQIYRCLFGDALSFRAESQTVRGASNAAYREGFLAHRKELVDDPRLLEWIRREDYLGADLLREWERRE
jgi:glycosyltransferase involved in cell wall biosynthesis